MAAKKRQQGGGDDEAGDDGTERITLRAGGHDVSFSSPHKVYFTQATPPIEKLDLARYYEHVAPAILRAIGGRPMVLRRFVHGVDAEPFFQKRAPKNLPPFLRTATLKYASGGEAAELVVDDVAGLLWAVNLGCVEMHVHPVKAEDLDHPDELRVDLDPVPGVGFAQVVEVAKAARAALDDVGLTGWPKTSGSRGIHIFCRIEPRWGFVDVRRAAIALADHIVARVPALATSTWRKEGRHGVLVDYNQNAKDRTTASAWSVRPTPDARVSMPIRFDDLDERLDPAAFTLRTVPALLDKRGDPHEQIGAAKNRGSLERLLALADARAATTKKKAGKQAKAAPATTKAPLLIIAQAKTKAEALAGLERWKAKHADVVRHLQPEHVLVDTQRGRSSAWYRIRINLTDVPEAARPAQQTPDPNWDPRSEYPTAEDGEDGA